MVLISSRIIGRMRSATPVMSEDTVLPFDLPSVARKKVSVGFDGGQLSSDAGVLVLRGAPCVVPAGPAQSRAHRAPGRGDVAASDVCDRGGLRGRRRLRFAPVRSDLQ